MYWTVFCLQDVWPRAPRPWSDLAFASNWFDFRFGFGGKVVWSHPWSLSCWFRITYIPREVILWCNSNTLQHQQLTRPSSSSSFSWVVMMRCPPARPWLDWREHVQLMQEMMRHRTMTIRSQCRRLPSGSTVSAASRRVTTLMSTETRPCVYTSTQWSTQFDLICSVCPKIPKRSPSGSLLCTRISTMAITAVSICSLTRNESSPTQQYVNKLFHHHFHHRQ